MRSDTTTLIAALRILSRDIYSEDGVANAAIAEAADRMEEMRLAIARLADQDATLSACDGNVTVTMDATLTNAERDAIERSAAAWETDARMGLSDGGVAVTLRGLLERTR